MRASFVISAASLADRPLPARPEFAFIGRSNCGKSSLINYFLGQRGLAKTSGQPGKTRLLNYFLVDERYYLVDLPGYGYARVSATQRTAWAALVRAYLAVGDRSLAVLHLLDARHEPSAEDIQMSGWLREAGLPFAVVATKTDKVGRTRLRAHYRTIITALALPAGTPFIPTTATRREGRGELGAWIASRLDLLGAERSGGSPP